MNDLLSLHISEFTILTKDFWAERKVDEVPHHDIHLFHRGSCKTSRLEILLPKLEILLLQIIQSISVEFVELILEELGEDSEAGSVEEEVELLVVLLVFGVGNIDLGLLGVLLGFLLWILRVLFRICGWTLDQDFLSAGDLRKVELLGTFWDINGLSLGLLKQKAFYSFVG